MTRPKIPRKIRCKACCNCFKPEGAVGEAASCKIEADELEALKLHDVDSLEQKQAAKKMGVSQPTFARILTSARKKVAGAIIRGEVINIIKE